MCSEFRSEFERLKKRKSRILALFRAMPESRRHEPKAKGLWTHAQNLHHLVKADEATLKTIQDSKIEPGTVAKNGLMYKMVLWLLSHRIRVPAPPKMLPEGDPSFDELEARWEKVMEGLQEAFDRAGPDGVIERHPQLGPISSWQVLRLLHAHLDYHEPEFDGTS